MISAWGRFGLQVVITPKVRDAWANSCRLQPSASLFPYSDVYDASKLRLAQQGASKKKERERKKRDQLYHQVQSLNRNPSSYRLCYETERTQNGAEMKKNDFRSDFDQWKRMQEVKRKGVAQWVASSGGGGACGELSMQCGYPIVDH